jgi:fumarate reductase flavoprotein subunit
MNQVQTELVVVAAGAAGLPAAIAAAQKGIEVIALEKASTPGGAANMGMGPLGIESRHTRARNFPPTVDQAFEIFMDHTHWRVDAKLVRAYLQKSGDTIHWLEDLGVEFVDVVSYFPDAFPTWHLIKPESGRPGPNTARIMVKTLTEKARALGVDIRVRTPARSLIKEKGRIVGVIAEEPSGEPLEIRANAVILATGGFGNNAEMIKEHTGYDLGIDLHPFKIPGLVGDGIRMAWEAGAAHSEMTLELIYYMPELVKLPPPLHEACRQPHLMVNLLGERFMNEAVMPNPTYTGNAISLQKDRCALLIFDDDIKEKMEKDLDTRSVVYPITRFENADASIQKVVQSGYGHFFKAHTIEELAKKTGIKSDALIQTIDEYNQCCARGYDALFNKPHRYLRPILRAPFYAARHFPSAYGSLGGIKINHRTEVLDTDCEIIPGLYAAGTDACDIYGDSYVFVLPGNTMGFAINTGRMAGENVADYIRSKMTS